MQTATGTPKAPTNISELRALVSRRDELSNQLEALSDRSGELIRERGDAAATNNAAVVADLDGRIRELSQRTKRIEGEKLASDDVIADALARGIGTNGDQVVIVDQPTPEVFTNFPPPFAPDARDTNREELLLGVGAVAMTAILMWRLARRSVEKRLKREGFGPTGGDSKELKHAIDAIAVEVERISENQRFVTALLSERQDIALPAELKKEPAERTK